MTGSTYPPELGRLTNDVVDRVAFLAANRLSGPWDSTVAGPDSVSVASILGWRGSGKTTVLKAACTELSRDVQMRYLVLPIIRPELFTEAQSVIASAMSGVQQLLELGPDSRRVATLPLTIGDETLELRAWANRLLRYGSALGQPSGRSETNLDEYIADSSKVSGASFEFTYVWSRFVRALLKAFGRSELVIPVDDADLAPQGFMHVLRSVRWLGEVENVVILLAADRDEGKASLYEDARLWAGETSEEVFVHLPRRSPQTERLRLVDGQLGKMLPIDGRTYVPEMTPVDCLRFRPLSSRNSLFDLLRRVLLPTNDLAVNSLADLFAVRSKTKALEPTWLADALPRNPRELTGVYRSIQRITPPEGTVTLPLSLVAELLDVFFRHGLRQSGLPQFEPSDFLTIEESAGGKFAFKLMLDGLLCQPRIRETKWYLNLVEAPVLGAGRDDDSESGSKRAWGASPERGMSISLPGPSEWMLERPKAGESRPLPRPLDSSLSASLWLAHELAFYFPRSFRLISNQRVQRRGGFNFAHYVECDGTDDRFFLAPDWESLIGGWHFYRGWGRIIDGVRSSTLNRDDRAVAILLDGWSLILELVGKRPIRQFEPRYITRPTPPTAQDLSREFSRVRNRYRAAVLGTAGDNHDYVEWFEELLAQSLHPWFLPTWATTRIWQLLVSEIASSPRATAAQYGLIDNLQFRVNRNLGALWVDPVLDMLQELSPDVGAELRLKHEHKRRVQAEAASMTARRSMEGEIRPQPWAAREDLADETNHGPSVDEVVRYLKSVANSEESG